MHFVLKSAQKRWPRRKSSQFSAETAHVHNMLCRSAKYRVAKLKFQKIFLKTLGNSRKYQEILGNSRKFQKIQENFRKSLKTLEKA